MSNQSKAIVAYVPVIHKGYLDFFRKENHPIWVIDPQTFPELDAYPYERDLRAIPPIDIVTSLKSLGVTAYLLDKAFIDRITDRSELIILPDEEISRIVANNLPPEKVHFEQVFLRWERRQVYKQFTIDAQVKIVSDLELSKLMQLASIEAQKSWDWWRRVGCLLVTKQGEQFLAHNHHLPNEQSPYINGDPRSDFNAGENIEASTAIHGEASLIANAARLGTSLEDATLFVTTFPCPGCAKFIAESGIKRVYFEEGYSLIQAQEILEAKEIEIIRLEP